MMFYETLYWVRFVITIFLFLFVTHCIFYYYNIDVYALLMDRSSKEIDDKDINVEENIRILQDNLKELSSSTPKE
jgi:hypothetical protein